MIEQPDKSHVIVMEPSEIHAGFAPHSGVLWIHAERDGQRVSIGLRFPQIDDFLANIESAKEQIKNPKW